MLLASAQRVYSYYRVLEKLLERLCRRRCPGGGRSWCDAEHRRREGKVVGHLPVMTNLLVVAVECRGSCPPFDCRVGLLGRCHAMLMPVCRDHDAMPAALRALLVGSRGHDGSRLPAART